MSATALILRFGKPVTLTRYAAGSFVNGTYVAGTPATSTIVMSVQPLSGRELLNLPEAQRTRQWCKAYTDVELQTSTQSSSQKADLITYNGLNYEVQAVEFWDSNANTIVPHWKVLLAEVNP